LKGLVKSPGQALLNLTTYATAAGIEKMFDLLEKTLTSLNDSCNDDPMLKEILTKLIKSCCKTLASASTELATQIIESKASEIAADVISKIEDGYAKKQANIITMQATNELLKNDNSVGLIASATEAVSEAGGEVVKEGAGKIVKNVVAEVAKKTSEKVVQQGTNKALKDATTTTAEIAVGKLLKEGASEAVTAAGPSAVNAAVKEVVKEGSEALKTVSTTAANLAVNEAVKEGAGIAIKTTGTTVAKIAGGGVVKEGTSAAIKAAGSAATEIAKHNTKGVVKAATLKAAESAAPNIAAACARVAGGITVGLGVFFIILDAYNLHADCKKLSLGDALLEIAKELEKTMANDIKD
jgi:hypothetical protein